MSDLSERLIGLKKHLERHNNANDTEHCWLAFYLNELIDILIEDSREGGDAFECHHYPKPGIYRAGKFITDNCASDEYRNEYVKGGIAIVGMVSDATGKRFMTQEEYDELNRDREAKERQE